MRVRFTWFDGEGYDVKDEIPWVAVPDQELTPRDIIVPWCIGRAVHLTLPGGQQSDSLIAGVYWNDALSSPLILLSRAASPSMYSVSMVVPGFSAGDTLLGCRKWLYHQVKAIPKIGERYPYPDRSFTPNIMEHFDFPAIDSAATSSEAEGNHRQSAASGVEPSPVDAIALALDEGSDALEAATYGAVLAASEAEAVIFQ